MWVPSIPGLSQKTSHRHYLIFDLSTHQFEDGQMVKGFERINDLHFFNVYNSFLRDISTKQFTIFDIKNILY